MIGDLIDNQPPLLFIVKVEAKKKVESENRELERAAALYKHDMKEVTHSHCRICLLSSLIHSSHIIHTIKEIHRSYLFVILSV